MKQIAAIEHIIENVYVIRADDQKKIKMLLEHFGLTFNEDKHGSGPKHYVSQKDGVVIEIYPTRSSGKRI